MLVDHYISGMNQEAGGTSTVVAQMCDELSFSQDQQVRLITQSFTYEKLKLPNSSSVTIQNIVIGNKLDRMVGFTVQKEYRKLIQKKMPDVLHIHGIWDYSCVAIQKIAMEANIKVIIQPHGMLEPWALSWRKYRKKLAMFAYQHSMLSSAQMIIATSEIERDSLEKILPSSTIEIVQNGIIFPKLVKRVRDHTTKKTALFISRIHPKKGIINLLSAWKQCNAQNWQLIIAGPDDDGHLSLVRKEIERLGIQSTVKYVGNLDDTEKWRYYFGSDVFILPSFSENFGLVVVEAMCASLPVVTTTGTPWRHLESKRCGWYIDPNVDAITEVLNIIKNLDDDELKKMGDRACDYAREFDWKKVVTTLKGTYRAVIS